MRIALILGGSPCVWSDVDQAMTLCKPAGVVACNDIGTRWPDLDAWVSLHADNFRAWINRRAENGHPPAGQVFTHATAASGSPRLAPEVTGFVDHLFPGQTTVGSSGLFALKVALVDLGFDKAILCGIPMSADANHLRHPGEPWTDADAHWPGWVEALPQIAGRARSVSGRTMDLLGAPTASWAKRKARK